MEEEAVEEGARAEDAGVAGDTAVRERGATRATAATDMDRAATAADTTAMATADMDTTATGATADTITPDTPITVNAASSTSAPARPVRSRHITSTDVT